MSTISKISLVVSAAKNLTKATALYSVAAAKYTVRGLPLSLRAFTSGMTPDDFRSFPLLIAGLGFEHVVPSACAFLADVKELRTGERPEDHTAQYSKGIIEGYASSSENFHRIAAQMEAIGMTHTPSTIQYIRNPKKVTLEMSKLQSVA